MNADPALTRLAQKVAPKGPERQGRLKLDFRPPLDWLAAVLGTEDGIALISDGGAQGRFSYVCPTIIQIDAATPTEAGARAFARRLTAKVSELAPTDGDRGAAIFSGGQIGLFGFEWGCRLESVERPVLSLIEDRYWPDACLWEAPIIIRTDHQDRTLDIVWEGAIAAYEAMAHELARKIAGATPPTGLKERMTESLTPGLKDAAYEAAIADTIARIHDGELFQANITRNHKGQLRPDLDPLDLFLSLQTRSAAPYGAYVRFGGRCVISNSPERFIGMDAKGLIETRPIKGTKRRSPDPAEDEALGQGLTQSAKDRAENLMIVDLMRHDLARSAVPGSVTVESLCALESYANVHHLVSCISAQLAPGLTAADLMIRAFPPGSVSGAPKVQALKTIALHEAEARGPYCGVLAWFGDDGAFDSSVLIRTFALEQASQGWVFSVSAGGGIVADSDPAEERCESDTKLSLINSVLNGEV